LLPLLGGQRLSLVERTVLIKDTLLAAGDIHHRFRPLRLHQDGSLVEVDGSHVIARGGAGVFQREDELLLLWRRMDMSYVGELSKMIFKLLTCASRVLRWEED